MQATRRPGAWAFTHWWQWAGDKRRRGEGRHGTRRRVHSASSHVCDGHHGLQRNRHGGHHRSLKAYTAIPGNGHIKTVTLKTYQADDYAGATTPLILFSDKSFQRAGGRIRITHIVHSKPGEGKVRVVAVGRDWLLLLLVLVLLLSRQRTSTALASRSNDVLPVSTPTCRRSVIAPPAQSIACSRVLGGKRGRR